MRKYIIGYIILFSLFILLISCNKSFFLQSYSSEDSSASFKKSIIIISDSTLNYSIKFGGIGAATTIGYSKIDSVLVIDSIDIYGRKSFQEFTDEIFNHEFFFSKDSLVNLVNGEKYFNNYTGNRNTKHCYIIINNKKRRITRFNGKRILTEIDTTKQELKPANSSEKMKYGININSGALKVIEK
jgi:hypothetical protein